MWWFRNAKCIFTWECTYKMMDRCFTKINKHSMKRVSTHARVSGLELLEFDYWPIRVLTSNNKLWHYVVLVLYSYGVMDLMAFNKWINNFTDIGAKFAYGFARMIFKAKVILIKYDNFIVGVIGLHINNIQF